MKLRISPTLAVLLAASMALSLAPQSREPKEDEPKGYPWNQTPTREARDVYKRFQGGWKLVSLQDPAMRTLSSNSAVGYMVISGSYVAVEIHVGIRSRSENRLIPAIRTGVHLMRVDGASLELSSLIGTFVDENGRARAEQPGESRSFEFVLTANQLTLTRGDGYELVLQRMHHGRTQFDIYGREIKDDADEESERKEDGDAQRRKP